MKLFFLTFLAFCAYASERFEETITPSWGQTFDVSEEIFQGRVGSQEALIFDNPLFGRILVINESIRVTEKDETIYHEMLVHPALIAHGKPLSVLIIGDLPLGALREVLRHKDVEKAVCVGVNRSLMNLAQEYMPFLSDGALEDPRKEIVFEDVSQYCKRVDVMFDIILCDGKGPFSKEFYADCKLRLNDGGILIDKCGTPFLDEEAFKASAKNRKAHFDTVTFYMVPIPTRIGGATAFGWASDVKHDAPLETLKKRVVKISGKTKYYTPQIQKAAFALPHFLLPPEKPAKEEKIPKKK